MFVFFNSSDMLHYCDIIDDIIDIIVVSVF